MEPGKTHGYLLTAKFDAFPEDFSSICMVAVLSCFECEAEAEIASSF